MRDPAPPPRTAAAPAQQDLTGDWPLIGRRWVGVNHGSVWMAFAADEPGVYDLVCLSPGSQAHLHAGQVNAGCDAAAIESFVAAGLFRPEEPA